MFSDPVFYFKLSMVFGILSMILHGIHFTISNQVPTRIGSVVSVAINCLYLVWYVHLIRVLELSPCF